MKMGYFKNLPSIRMSRPYSRKPRLCRTRHPLVFSSPCITTFTTYLQPAPSGADITEAETIRKVFHWCENHDAGSSVFWMICGAVKRRPRHSPLVHSSVRIPPARSDVFTLHPSAMADWTASGQTVSHDAAKVFSIGYTVGGAGSYLTFCANSDGLQAINTAMQTFRLRFIWIKYQPTERGKGMLTLDNRRTSDARFSPSMVSAAAVVELVSGQADTESVFPGVSSVSRIRRGDGLGKPVFQTLRVVGEFGPCSGERISAFENLIEPRLRRWIFEMVPDLLVFRRNRTPPRVKIPCVPRQQAIVTEEKPEAATRRADWKRQLQPRWRRGQNCSSSSRAGQQTQNPEPLFPILVAEHEFCKIIRPHTGLEHFIPDLPAENFGFHIVHRTAALFASDARVKATATADFAWPEKEIR